MKGVKAGMLVLLTLSGGAFLTLFPSMGCGPNPSSPSGPTPTPTCSAASGVFGAGGGITAGSINLIIVARVQFTSHVQVTGMHSLICAQDGVTPVDVNAGIYTDVAGAPGTLVAPAVSQSVTACGSPYQFNFSGSIPLPAGYYWLAVGSATGSGNVGFNVASGGTNLIISGQSLPVTFPGGATTYTFHNDVWADWTCP